MPSISISICTTSDAEHEKRALEMLRRHSAHDVHLHQIPERAGKLSDVPRERPRVLRILERPPEPGTPPPTA
jgi:hypothetical protein